jgi:hypothetical protein
LIQLLWVRLMRSRWPAFDPAAMAGFDQSKVAALDPTAVGALDAQQMAGF